MKRYVLKQTSQRDLARRAGVTESCVSLILNGKRNPRFATAKRLAKALKMSVSDFFNWLYFDCR